MHGREDITRLLEELSEGDGAAYDRLLPLVYEELRRIAHRQLLRERDDHTFDTGALVHEVYLRLVDLNRIAWQGRAHFFAIAAQAMRQILINYGVRRRAAKRGGAALRVGIEAAEGLSDARAEDLLALDEALQRLSQLDARQGRIVELRFFGGLSVEETAEVLGISPATVKRDWTVARAWLNRELR